MNEMKIHRPLPGLVQIDAASDAKYRAFLVNACAPNARALMKTALDETPSPLGRLRSNKFFGNDELIAIIIRTNVVISECEDYCPGICNWLTTTGYANEPSMIKAFAAWAEQPADLREIVPTTKAN